jgi:outer membrane biogenesis lipoprotein LolB
MRHRLRAAVILGAGLLGGCAASHPALPSAPSALPSAAGLEAQLAARRDVVQSLRALVRLRYRAPDESGTSRQAIVVARPDRLRVEVLSLLGSVFVVTTDKGAITAYVRQEDTVYRGAASPENLERYARVGLPVSDLIDIVLATPAPQPTDHEWVSFDAAVGAVRLVRTLVDRQQSVWFAPAGMPVAAEERGADGKLDWRATFGGYEDHDGVPIATQVTIELPRWSRSLELALAEVDVNPALDNSIFAFQTPPGSKVVNLESIAD